MKRCIAAFAIIFIIIAGSINALAANGVSAKSAILIEKDSGRVMFEKTSAERLPMASTTKIMTAVVALESNNAQLDKEIEISDGAAGVEGSSMYLQKGEVMTLRDLLYGLMLSSGNDAAVAIAEDIAGSQEKFAELMNQKAAEIGMENSHFTNPNGLPDDNHYSTAADMARLCAYAMKNETFCDIASTKSYKITGEKTAYPRALSNHNKLLNMYDGCVGVKTGFTKAAGRCLVSAAQRGGMTLICVTLNAPDDWRDHMSLFDYGFSTYSYTKGADASRPVCGTAVNGSADGAVPVYPERDIYYPTADGEGFSDEIEILPELSAPMKEGEQAGKMHITICKSESGSKIDSAEVPLVVKSDVVCAKKTDVKNTSFTRQLKLLFMCWLRLCS